MRGSVWCCLDGSDQAYALISCRGVLHGDLADFGVGCYFDDLKSVFSWFLTFEFFFEILAFEAHWVGTSLRVAVGSRPESVFVGNVSVGIFAVR